MAVRIKITITKRDITSWKNKTGGHPVDVALRRAGLKPAGIDHSLYPRSAQKFLAAVDLNLDVEPLTFTLIFPSKAIAATHGLRVVDGRTKAARSKK